MMLLRATIFNPRMRGEPLMLGADKVNSYRHVCLRNATRPAHSVTSKSHLSGDEMN